MVTLKTNAWFNVSYLAVVGLFGFLGACFRFLISLVYRFIQGSSFPWETLSVNLIGCFILAWLYCQWEDSQKLPKWFRVGFSTGFIGSFTTFSTFSLEWIEMVGDQQWFFAALYSGLSLFGGFGAIVVGFQLARRKGEIP